MKCLQHFITITRHKILVMKYCFRVGLYKQGILHDLSKYSWAEFSTGVKYYQGYRSPNAAEIDEKGYSEAWLHHKGRNKHHMEYWIDYSMKENERVTGVKMPVKYVVEMFCDRVAANKIYKKEGYEDGDPLAYYQITEKKIVIHDESRALLVRLLTMLKDHGEEVTFKYIRENVLKI